MIREIVLDTETTGLDPATGDRIVEIGAVELINHLPTGNYYHQYINPDRDMPAEAFNVHGLSAEFLADYPVFSARWRRKLSGVHRRWNSGDPQCPVRHEIHQCRTVLDEARHTLPMERVIDSLALARKRHPMGPNSLDALCRRYGIDNSRREKHGALLDSELLADVYIELIGGRQTTFSLTEERATVVVEQQIQSSSARQRPQALPSRLTSTELELHAKMVAKLGDDALWRAKN
jgi:DNA polymerase-3 subunit epsilon